MLMGFRLILALCLLLSLALVSAQAQEDAPSDSFAILESILKDPEKHLEETPYNVHVERKAREAVQGLKTQHGLIKMPRPEAWRDKRMLEAVERISKHVETIGLILGSQEANRVYLKDIPQAALAWFEAHKSEEPDANPMESEKHLLMLLDSGHQAAEAMLKAWPAFTARGFKKREKEKETKEEKEGADRRDGASRTAASEANYLLDTLKDPAAEAEGLSKKPDPVKEKREPRPPLQGFESQRERDILTPAADSFAQEKSPREESLIPPGHRDGDGENLAAAPPDPPPPEPDPRKKREARLALAKAWIGLPVPEELKKGARELIFKEDHRALQESRAKNFAKLYADGDGKDKALAAELEGILALPVAERGKKTAQWLRRAEDGLGTAKTRSLADERTLNDMLAKAMKNGDQNKFEHLIKETERLYALNPDLAARQALDAERAGLILKSFQENALPDGFIVAPKVLGREMENVGGLEMATEDGRHGFWTLPKPGTELIYRFESADGRLRIVKKYEGGTGKEHVGRQYLNEDGTIAREEFTEDGNTVVIHYDYEYDAAGRLARRTMRGPDGEESVFFNPASGKPSLVEKRGLEEELLMSLQYQFDGSLVQRIRQTIRHPQEWGAGNQTSQVWLVAKGNSDRSGVSLEGTPHQVILDEKTGAFLGVELVLQEGEKGYDIGSLVEAGLLGEREGMILASKLPWGRTQDLKERDWLVPPRILVGDSGATLMFEERKGGTRYRDEFTKFSFDEDLGKWVYAARAVNNDGGAPAERVEILGSWDHESGRFGHLLLYKPRPVSRYDAGKDSWEDRKGVDFYEYAVDPKTGRHYEVDKKVLTDDSVYDWVTKNIGWTMENVHVFKEVGAVTHKIAAVGKTFGYEITGAVAQAIGEVSESEDYLRYGITSRYQGLEDWVGESTRTFDNAGAMFEELRRRLGEKRFQELREGWVDEIRAQRAAEILEEVESLTDQQADLLQGLQKKVQLSSFGIFEGVLKEPPREEAAADWKYGRSLVEKIKQAEKGPVTDAEIARYLMGSEGFAGAGGKFADKAMEADSTWGKVLYGSLAVQTYAAGYTFEMLGFAGVSAGVGALSKGAKSLRDTAAVMRLGGRAQTWGRLAKSAGGMKNWARFATALEKGAVGTQKLQHYYFRAIMAQQGLELADAVEDGDDKRMANAMMQITALGLIPHGKKAAPKRGPARRGLANLGNLAIEALTTTTLTKPIAWLFGKKGEGRPKEGNLKEWIVKKMLGAGWKPAAASFHLSKEPMQLGPEAYAAAKKSYQRGMREINRELRRLEKRPGERTSEQLKELSDRLAQARKDAADFGLADPVGKRPIDMTLALALERARLLEPLKEAPASSGRSKPRAPPPPESIIAGTDKRIRDAIDAHKGDPKAAYEALAQDGDFLLRVTATGDHAAMAKFYELAERGGVVAAPKKFTVDGFRAMGFDAKATFFAKAYEKHFGNSPGRDSGVSHSWGLHAQDGPMSLKGTKADVEALRLDLAREAQAAVKAKSFAERNARSALAIARESAAVAERSLGVADPAKAEKLRSVLRRAVFEAGEMFRSAFTAKGKRIKGEKADAAYSEAKGAAGGKAFEAMIEAYEALGGKGDARRGVADILAKATLDDISALVARNLDVKPDASGTELRRRAAERAKADGDYFADQASEMRVGKRRLTPEELSILEFGLIAANATWKAGQVHRAAGENAPQRVRIVEGGAFNVRTLMILGKYKQGGYPKAIFEVWKDFHEVNKARLASEKAKGDAASESSAPAARSMVSRWLSALFPTRKPGRSQRRSRSPPSGTEVRDALVFYETEAVVEVQGRAPKSENAKLDKIAEQSLKTFNDIMSGKVEPPEGTTRERVRWAGEGHPEYGVRIPVNYQTPEQYFRMQSDIAGVMESFGITDARVTQIGSACGIVKGNPKKYDFDPKTNEIRGEIPLWGPKSDVDFAVYSPQLLALARRRGVLINKDKAVMDGKATIFKNNVPGAEVGFYETAVGRKLKELADRWNKELYPDETAAGTLVEGVEFKLNISPLKAGKCDAIEVLEP